MTTPERVTAYALTDWNVVLLHDAEVSITGKRGRYWFRYAETSGNGAVSLTFYGGTGGHCNYRSFRPDQIKDIHRGRGARP